MYRQMSWALPVSTRLVVFGGVWVIVHTGLLDVSHNICRR